MYVNVIVSKLGNKYILTKYNSDIKTFYRVRINMHVLVYILIHIIQSRIIWLIILKYFDDIKNNLCIFLEYSKVKNGKYIEIGFKLLFFR